MQEYKHTTKVFSTIYYVKFKNFQLKKKKKKKTNLR